MSESFAQLQGCAIVYFGNEWFAENRTSSHHIARRLPAHCPVLYVDSPGLRAPRATGRDVRRLYRKLRQAVAKPTRVAPDLWHCTVPQIPFRRLPGVETFNRWFGRWAVRRAIRAAGFTRTISWFVLPHPGFLAGELGEEYVVYYCIDDYAAHPGVNQITTAAADAALAVRADHVFVAPPALLESKRAQNVSTSFSPHGVDYELFSKAADPATQIPAAAAQLTRPIIGFFGLMGDWIDVELLEYLARARPSWTFLIVGHVATDASRLVALSNCVFVGPQPYESLAGWAKAFDVALIPYRMNQQVKNANPLKLREYLATGKPIVSVPTPEVDRFSGLVRIAATREKYLEAVEQSLTDQDAQQRAARMSAVQSMTWDARVTETLNIVCNGLAAKRAGSARVMHK
jgi:glycosyltransferase involved in cell wall biosynthesis